MITAFDKAIVAVLAGVASPVLAHFGLSLDSTLSQVVVAVVGGLLVYLVPNKKV